MAEGSIYEVGLNCGVPALDACSWEPSVVDFLLSRMDTRLPRKHGSLSRCSSKVLDVRSVCSGTESPIFALQWLWVMASAGTVEAGEHIPGLY